MARQEQVIRKDESYTVGEFRKRAGLGDYAYRRARKEGLRVVEIGKKRYVRGIDWLEHLDRAAEGDSKE